jgi:hypothetical protein
MLTMSQNARTFMLSKFDIRKCTSSLEDLYDKTISA